MRFFALFVWLVLALTTGYALFDITFRVEAMEERLADLNRQILKEQEALHVLGAEWSFLNRPARMGKLVNDLMPEMYELTSAQIVLPADLPERGEGTGEGVRPVLPASIGEGAEGR